REREEEAGLKPRQVHLEQLATYGAPNRDPRMRTVTVAYLALAPDLPAPRAGGDAAAADWLAVDELVKHRSAFAFDHNEILKDGLERARAKLEYSPRGASFCPAGLTVGGRRAVYGGAWGAPPQH